MASKISPVAERPASMPARPGSIEPSTTPHTPGIRLGFSPSAMMQVEVPTTLTTSPKPTPAPIASQDRKSTRLNSSHRCISYAVFCLKKKKKHNKQTSYKLTTSYYDTSTPLSDSS